MIFTTGAGAADGKNNLCKLTTDLQISVNDVWANLVQSLSYSEEKWIFHETAVVAVAGRLGLHFII